ncbi:hypothetical protein SELMODRAFT_424454 [Selaginella moellendorffii]|uniref:Uncharacterized protein n=1 Tax=Selaginella moellendorffii TaxID=88036 RepID=D8SPY1_SELML|nr:hypothetical protein SELMODRAFT_424454 [Selaginella moellendorffii]
MSQCSSQDGLHFHRVHLDGPSLSTWLLFLEPSSLDYHTLSWVTSWFQPTILVATPEACKFVLSKDSFETGWPKSTVVLIGQNLFAGLTEEIYLKLQKLIESL